MNDHEKIWCLYKKKLGLSFQINVRPSGSCGILPLKAFSLFFPVRLYFFYFFSSCFIDYDLLYTYICFVDSFQHLETCSADRRARLSEIKITGKTWPKYRPIITHQSSAANLFLAPKIKSL